MFTYDLAAGHRTVFGDEQLFNDCTHHLVPGQIPLHEATRLLFNRCSGLLLARDYLRMDTLTDEAKDFIGRNHAKAQLAFGDALLTAFGQYHWSCTERHQRLEKLSVSEAPPWLAEVRKHHAAGVDFKLHPRRSEGTKAEFEQRQVRMAIWDCDSGSGLKVAGYNSHSTPLAITPSHLSTNALKLRRGEITCST